MQAKKGGYAVQRRYRSEGRIGLDHPAHKAADVSAAQRKWRKQERLAAQARSVPPSDRLDSLCSERATRNAQKSNFSAPIENPRRAYGSQGPRSSQAWS